MTPSFPCAGWMLAAFGVAILAGLPLSRINARAQTL
jgi:hypothetical protein